MLSRDEMFAYAQGLCIPMLERAVRRKAHGLLSYKPDQVGYVPAYLENLCRPFWGLAPVLLHKSDLKLRTEQGLTELSAFLRDELLAGLSHGQDGSWDRCREWMSPYSYENQCITELAGLMVGMFFARKVLWDPLNGSDKQKIADALYAMAEIAFDYSWPNNHYWFPLLTLTVLKRFGFIYARTEEMLDKGLKFLDSLYLGNGWYKDGEFGRFDYYEAWSLHLYPLLWSLIADESFTGWQERKREYVNRTNRFLPFFVHWFADDGAMVPFGRSLSYRFAASAIFPVAVLAGCDLDPSLAGRITAMNIDFFRQNYKESESGILEEGYLYHSPGTVEGYTSDGGAYWCCKTFLCLLIPPEHPFWRFDRARLPAEQCDFTAFPEQKDIQLAFHAHRGIVTMYNNAAQYVLGGIQTHHFGDMRAWYGKFAYNSASGFACSTSDTVSYDSMISLQTPDETMASHRVGFTVLSGSERILRSIHTPFSNDPDTKIETCLLLLENCHVRAHKITLSRQYRVREGGFALGRWDDERKAVFKPGFAMVSNRRYTSVMKVWCSCPTTVFLESSQAGYHLYAPLASYPAWRTDVLPEGEYCAISVFAVFPIGEEEELPDPVTYFKAVFQ
jgi:hypothetical protein